MLRFINIRVFIQTFYEYESSANSQYTERKSYDAISKILYYMYCKFLSVHKVFIFPSPLQSSLGSTPAPSFQPVGSYAAFSRPPVRAYSQFTAPLVPQSIGAPVTAGEFHCWSPAHNSVALMAWRGYVSVGWNCRPCGLFGRSFNSVAAPLSQSAVPSDSESLSSCVTEDNKLSGGEESMRSVCLLHFCKKKK